MEKTETMGDYEVLIGTLEKNLRGERMMLREAHTVHNDAEMKIVYGEKEIKRLEKLIPEKKAELEKRMTGLAVSVEFENRDVADREKGFYFIRLVFKLDNSSDFSFYPMTKDEAIVLKVRLAEVLEDTVTLKVNGKEVTVSSEHFEIAAAGADLRPIMRG